MNELNVNNNKVSVNSRINKYKKKISINKKKNFDFNKNRHRDLRWNSNLFKSLNFITNASIILNINMNINFPFIIVINDE